MAPLRRQEQGELGAGSHAELPVDALQVEVLVVEPLGAQNLLTVKIGEDLVKVATHPTFRVEPGNDVWLRFPGEKIRWVDRETGQALLPSQE